MNREGQDGEEGQGTRDKGRGDKEKGIRDKGISDIWRISPDPFGKLMISKLRSNNLSLNL